MVEIQFRDLDDSERQIIDRLLEEGFRGRDEIREQINNSLVGPLDANGSVRFQVGSSPIVDANVRIPVEGEFEDIDGVTIHVLLHVVNGRVEELEIYKEDGSQVIKIPTPTELRIFHPD